MGGPTSHRSGVVRALQPDRRSARRDHHGLATSLYLLQLGRMGGKGKGDIGDSDDKYPNLPLPYKIKSLMVTGVGFGGSRVATSSWQPGVDRRLSVVLADSSMRSSTGRQDHVCGCWASGCALHGWGRRWAPVHLGAKRGERSRERGLPTGKGARA